PRGECFGFVQAHHPSRRGRRSYGAPAGFDCAVRGSALGAMLLASGRLRLPFAAGAPLQKQSSGSAFSVGASPSGRMLWLCAGPPPIAAGAPLLQEALTL